jgi:hypothetical protein
MVGVPMGEPLKMHPGPRTAPSFCGFIFIFKAVPNLPLNVCFDHSFSEVILRLPLELLYLGGSRGVQRDPSDDEKLRTWT